MKSEEQMLEEAKKIVEKRQRRSENWKKAWPKLVTALAIVAMLGATLGIVNFKFDVDANVDYNGAAPIAAVAETTPAAPTAPATTAPSAAPAETTASSQSDGNAEKPADATKAGASSSTDAPKTNEEIVKKYTELLNKMKQDQPGYTKKEYQALPQEYRNFSSAINSLLKFGEAYMTTEDNPDSLVTATKGEIYTAEDGTTMPRINHELPICNTGSHRLQLC